MSTPFQISQASKTGAHNSRQPDAFLRQQHRKVKQLRRKIRQQNQALPKHVVDIDVTVADGGLELLASDVHVDTGETSTSLAMSMHMRHMMVFLLLARRGSWSLDQIQSLLLLVI